MLIARFAVRRRIAVLVPNSPWVALLAVGVTAVSSPAWAATHYLTLINDDAVPALTVELAPQGTTDWQVVDTAGPLQGGRAGQATVTVPDRVCVVDVRVTYPDRGPLTITQWNACRQPTLYLGKARRTGLRRPGRGF